jgi:hypothetical protein
MAQNGAGPMPVISITRSPLSGPGMIFLPFFSATNPTRRALFDECARPFFEVLAGRNSPHGIGRHPAQFRFTQFVGARCDSEAFPHSERRIARDLGGKFKRCLAQTLTWNEAID